MVIMVLGLVLVFGAIFGFKAYMGAKMGAMMSAPPPPAVVASAEARSESWSPVLSAVGSLVATQGVAVTNEVAGQVREINFRSGEKVKAGEVVVQLDDQVDRATLDGLVAERKLAEIQFKRARELFKENQAVPEASVDEAQAKLDSARAHVVAQEALIAKKRIRAPFSGLLGIRQVNVGQFLNPGSPIVQLEALDPIYADFSLPERNFARLGVGQDVEVRVQSYGDQVFKGRIAALNPGVDAATRTVRVRAELDNPDGRLRPGMFAEVRLTLPEPRDVVVIPSMAVTYQPYGDSVFVVAEKDGATIAERRPIETGETRVGDVEVVKGLKSGETIVRAGHVKLRNGMPVKVDNSVPLETDIARP
jgi:membrane fusion protein (multidrug efflux system)